MRDIVQTTEQPSVLVVDDEPANRRILVDVVGKLGFRAVQAAGGSEALQILAAEHFDLVLLDLMMPAVDGMAVLAEMARGGLLLRSPVVVVTAHDDRATRSAALQAGAIDFLAKPVSYIEVSCKVRALVELSRLRGEALARTAREAASGQMEKVEHAVGGLPMALFELQVSPMAAMQANWVLGDVETATGLSRDEFFVQHDRLARVHPEDRPPMLSVLADMQSGDVATAVTRFRLEVKGEYRWRLQASRFDPQTATIRGVVLAIDDQVHLEEQLRQTQKLEAVGRLAGGIAHDFNNLIAVILSYGAFIRDSLDPTDARREDAHELLGAAERAASLTKQLLAFARQQPAERTAVDINDHLGKLERLLAKAAGEAVEVAVEPLPRPAVISIDPGQFDQILINLAVNARDAMPQGGKLTISVREGQGPGMDRQGSKSVRLLVTDTGCGMTDEVQRRIFDPFFTTKEQGKGTGLGLATCYGIVQDAGGTIRVLSAPGRGTTFIVEFPMLADLPAATATSRESAPARRGETVLLAEDEAPLRRVSARILENAGYTVHTAADGTEARQLIDELGPRLDILVSDVVMPGCDGYAVAEHAARVAPHLQVVLTSGYLGETGGRQGAANCQLLFKPVSGKDLLRAVAQAAADRAAKGTAQPLGVGRAGAASAVRLPSLALPARETRRGRGERLLVVDDDLPLASAIARILVGDGFEVAIAGTLAAAREHLASTEFAALLTDINLPDGNSLDMLQEFRSTSPDLAIVVMTGAPTVATAAQAVRTRISEYLPKPFSADELLRVMLASVEFGRVARLRSKLLAAHFGGDEFVRDFAVTEASFDRALPKIRMVFQPIVHAQDGAVFGYEALLRCDEPKLDTPQRLLAAAEVLGRVIDVGKVVRAGVAAAIESAQPLAAVIFVNLHPSELRADLLGDDSEPLLRHAGRVVLEVTERASLQSGPRLDSELAKIRALGYRLALDDLGEGYSGLSNLIHVRPDVVKIDMFLVRDIDRSPLKVEIVRALVQMARQACIAVVAEGVETEGEREVLVDLGCDLLQGYLFGRPNPSFAVGGKVSERSI